MALDEKSMTYLEQQIPELADVAIKQAYWHALASGSSVLVAENGILLEVFPDGTQKIIRHLMPSTPITADQKLIIRS